MVNSNYLIQAIYDCEQALNNPEEKLEKLQQACHDLGNILQGMGRFNEAVQWHSLASDSEPNKGEIYSYLGQLHIGQQNWKKAIASLKNGLQYQPKSAKVYSFLAQVYGHLGEKETEIEYWYEAANLSPNLINAHGYHRLGRFLQAHGQLDKAITCYQRAQERSNGSLLEVECHLGEIWLQKGKLDQSIAIYQKILEQDPTYAKAHHKLGTIYLKQKRYEDAIIAFRQAIKLQSDFASAYRDLVRTFIQLKRFDEAIATCHAIINLVQEYPWVYTHLSNALRQKGQLVEAAASLQKACALKGWQECQTNDYSFARDNFSYRIATWESCFQPLINRPQTHILLLGDEQDMSVCWLLDKILTHPSAKLTYIQESNSEQLDTNLAKTKAAEKVTQLTGNIHKLANSLEADTFDVVILQDKCKLTTRAQKNASLAWTLAKGDGLIIFNDYDHNNRRSQDKNPRLGIEQFLSSVQDQWSTMPKALYANQFIIQKKKTIKAHIPHPYL
ncbi:MAG: tetratricopeptide repeat protein [Xenococcaceae cyanobacterium MO_188.B29]|nr:tetratricopeptide repeat protein [Xenococcaceae cyanobacterium MO_188.B29]